MSSQFTHSECGRITFVDGHTFKPSNDFGILPLSQLNKKMSFIKIKVNVYIEVFPILEILFTRNVNEN